MAQVQFLDALHMIKEIMILLNKYNLEIIEVLNNNNNSNNNTEPCLILVMVSSC